MSGKITLYDIRDKNSTVNPESVVGSFIDNLLHSDERASVSVKQSALGCQLTVRSTGTGQLKGFDFYENRFESIGDISDSHFINLLSVCSSGLKTDAFNAEIKFYDRDMHVLISNPPLRLRSHQIHNESESGVEYTINMSNNIIPCCKSIRRRSETYDDLQYEIKEV